ncbi:MAG: hypothetical protein WKG07_02640 [Hymenobacter sp.]
MPLFLLIGAYPCGRRVTARPGTAGGPRRWAMPRPRWAARCGPWPTTRPA